MFFKQVTLDEDSWISKHPAKCSEMQVDHTSSLQLKYDFCKEKTSLILRDLANVGSDVKP